MSNEPGMTESLVTGRAKRSTAGNRMKELLEQALDEDEIFEEVQDDVEFVAVADEPDIIDSDFDQDTEDEGDDDDEAGERELQEQEKEARKASRAKVVPLHMRRPAMKQPKARPQAVIDGPSAAEAALPATKDGSRAARIAARRIAFAEGATLGSRSGSSGQPRSSSRKATAQKKADTMARIREEEAKRAAAPVRAPVKKKAKLTQDALIAEALEMEEANRESLRRFFEQEEQRKARDLKKQVSTFDGPWIRWRSVATEPFVSPIAPMLQPTDKTGIAAAATAAALNTPTMRLTEDPAVQARREAQALKEAEAAKAKAREEKAEDKGTPAVEGDVGARDVAGPSTGDVIPAETPVPSQGSEAASQIEDQALARPASGSKVVNKPSAHPSRREMRNFISIHGLESGAEPSSTSIGASERSSATPSPSKPPAPTWADEFRFLLGDHCQWDAPVIVPARNRPAKPRQSTCVITGLPALYKDPKTGIAFATAEAYGILRDLEQQKFTWVGEGLAGESTTASGGADTQTEDDGDGGKKRKRKGKGRETMEGSSGDAETDKENKDGTTGVKSKVRPLAMGCYLGRPDDDGADGILAAANAEFRRIQAEQEASATDKGTLTRGQKGKEKEGAVAVRGRAPSQVKAGASAASAPAPDKAAGSDPPSSSSSSSAAAAKRPRPGWYVAPPSTVPAVAPGDEKALVAEALKLTSRTRSGRASRSG